MSTTVKVPSNGMTAASRFKPGLLATSHTHVSYVLRT